MFYIERATIKIQSLKKGKQYNYNEKFQQWNVLYNAYTYTSKWMNHYNDFSNLLKIKKCKIIIISLW